VAADFVVCDVPLVISHEISYLPFWIKANPNSTESIVNKLALVWFGKKVDLQGINKYYLSCSNRRALSVWKDYLG
jgi:hypothetical protein